MAVRLTTWFVTQGLSVNGGSTSSRPYSKPRFSFQCPPSCKLCHCNLSCNSVNKRQRLKKKESGNQSSTTTDFQFSGGEDSKSESSVVGIVPILGAEGISDDEADVSLPRTTSSNDESTTTPIEQHLLVEQQRIVVDYFHLLCLDSWLKLNGSCPICRNSSLPTPLSTPLHEVMPLSQYLVDSPRD